MISPHQVFENCSVNNDVLKGREFSRLQGQIRDNITGCWPSYRRQRRKEKDKIEKGAGKRGTTVWELVRVYTGLFYFFHRRDES